MSESKNIFGGSDYYKGDKPARGIVGHCPCGAPIYGVSVLLANDVTDVTYSCGCKQTKSITSQMETK